MVLRRGTSAVDRFRAPRYDRYDRYDRFDRFDRATHLCDRLVACLTRGVRLGMHLALGVRLAVTARVGHLDALVVVVLVVGRDALELLLPRDGVGEVVVHSAR